MHLAPLVLHLLVQNNNLEPTVARFFIKGPPFYLDINFEMRFLCGNVQIAEINTIKHLV